MVQELNQGIFLTQLQIIPTANGDVLHGMKHHDLGFAGFGEAYFSQVENKCFKGWKKHHKMTLNLVVPVGEICFYLVDERTPERFVTSLNLSPENYCRLTVPPGVWLGFQGIKPGTNLLLNIASITHDPGEVKSAELSAYSYLFNNLKAIS